MESWRLVWRQGFCPHLSTPMLKALLEACEKDDQNLIQGSTTEPPPLMCVADWPCEGGCALGLMSASEYGGFGKCTVGQAEEGFAQLCFKCDQTLGEPAACRWFLNWFDETPREEMIRELIPEIERELASRPKPPLLW